MLLAVCGAGILCLVMYISSQMPMELVECPGMDLSLESKRMNKSPNTLAINTLFVA